MTTLPPGFRFHPTDAELVGYYLVKKVRGQPIEFDVVADVDLYKCEPWDLPDKSRIPSKDLEWFFFSPRDKKYPNGSRTNRATEKGYWKATGRDRNVKLKSRSTGMKKTLVYYRGRAPNGERTDWLMHEYRLEGEPSDETNSSQDGYVLCRVFKKSALDHTLKSSKSTKIAPAPMHETDNSVFTEYDVKPHLEALPLQALTAEPLSESQVVEDDDLSEEVTTAVYPDEELPKDAHTRPAVAVSPASSEYDSEYNVPFDGSSALKYAVMQGTESDFSPWDDGGIELPIITDLWDMDLPDLVIDSPVSDPLMFSTENDDYFSPSVETEYNGDPFPTIFGSGEPESDISPLGIIRKTSSLGEPRTPPSRTGNARQRSQWKKSVRCPKEISCEEQPESTTPVRTSSSPPKLGVQVHEVATDDEKDGKISDAVAVTVDENKLVTNPEPESVETETSKEQIDDAAAHEHKLWAETIISSPSLDNSTEPKAEVEKSITNEHAGETSSEIFDDSSSLTEDPLAVVDDQPNVALSKTSDAGYIERGIITPASGLLNITLSFSFDPTSAASMGSASKIGPISLEAVVGSSSGNVTIRLVVLPNMHPLLEEHGENHIMTAGKRSVQKLLTAPNNDVPTETQESLHGGIGDKSSVAYLTLFVYTLGLILPQLVQLTSDAQTGSKPTPSRADGC